MNKFVFNGCSQTAGREVLVNDPDAPDWVSNKHVWAKHLMDLINEDGEYVNLAESGSSNDSIYRSTIEYLASCKSHKDMFVGIMWTEPQRFEFELMDGSKIDIIAASKANRNSEEKYLRKFVNEYMAYKDLTAKRNLNYFLSMEKILESLGIPYIMCNGFNNSHFYRDDLVAGSPYMALSTYKGKSLFIEDRLSLFGVLNDKFEMTKHYHFREDAHKYYAYHLHNILGELI